LAQLALAKAFTAPDRSTSRRDDLVLAKSARQSPNRIADKDAPIFRLVDSECRPQWLELWDQLETEVFQVTKPLTILLLFLVWCPPLEEFSTYRGWVLWNVGQGQWLTMVEPQTCKHFDLGGEQAPWKLIQKYCRDRLNQIFLSHDDQDHISFLKGLLRRFPSTCILNEPHLRKPALKKTLRKLQCGQEIIRPWSVRYEPPKHRKNNRNSQVVVVRDVLIPGDSTRSDEKLWTRLIPHDQVQILILGHHGSLTSTSKDLLNTLTSLKMAFASARKKRYGHPHPQVVERLQKRKTPVLSTENWGHIHFQSFN
jgi:competence protein ComEC